MLLWSMQIKALLEPAPESETYLRVTRHFGHKVDERMVSWCLQENPQPLIEPWKTKSNIRLDDATRCLDAEIILSES